MKRILALALLIAPLAAFGQSHEANLAQLGVPPAGRPGVFCFDWPASGLPFWTSAGCASASAFQVNGVNLASSSTVNFENAAATNGVTLQFSNPSAGNVQLVWNGTLTPSGGGTGLTSITLHDIVIGNGTSSVTLLAPSATAGEALCSQGASADPTYCVTLPGVTAVNGTTIPAASTLATQSGAWTIGHCAQIASTSGALADAGAACGSGGSGITQLTGDVTAGPGSGSQAATVVAVNGAAVPASAAVLSSNASSQLTVATTTGSGSVVRATSPTLTTPNLGTPSAAVLTNASGTAASLTAGQATAALGLKSATTTVAVSTATAPTSGQVLTATSSTAASWQTPTTGSGTVNSGTSGQLAYYASTGTAVSGETTVTATQLGASSAVLADIQANTTFTVAGTGCTPSAHTGGPFAGTVTLAATCTAITVTFNGATGFTAPNGYVCSVGDKTALAAGTWIPRWGASSTTTTTATIPIPSAAGATDVIDFMCQYD